MKRRIGWLALLALCCAMLCAAHADEDPLLYLTFDEGTGASVSDASGRWPEENVEYQYLHAAFADDMEPEWRDAGVVNGALLFDGCSTCIRYPKNTILLQGDKLTISVWVAPRAFEWDDPEAAARGEAHPTAILGQYSKVAGQGVLLGYQRFGRLCFEVGADTGWYTLWADEARLTRYAWNHVAAVFDGK